MDPQTPIMPSRRYEAIDLIRFLGCLAIAIWHYQHFSFVGHALPDFDVTQQPFYRWASLFYEHGGRFRVQTFWSISGFALFLVYGRVIAAHSLRPRRFFLDRVARLYPLYLLSFAIVGVLQGIHVWLNGVDFVYQDNDLLHALLSLAMASAWWPGSGMSYNGPVWSLSVLIPVYAVFFAMVWRRGLSIRLNLGMVVGASLFYAAFPDARILECAAHFFAGGIGAIVLFRHGDGRYGPALRRLAVGVLGVFGVVAWFWGDVVVVPVIHTVLLVVIPTLCFAAASLRRLPDWLGAAFQRLGDLSYGVFLLHFPLQLAVVLLADRAGVSLPVLSPWFFLLYLALILVLAQIGLVLCERPAQRFLRRLFGTVRAAPAVAGRP
ncbi:MAG: acyltransferase [Rhodobacteraceae bacterium]|nr:acyltransferase [Paracoccaceae bacterium]